MKTNKGFAPIVAIILAVLVIGGGVAVIKNKNAAKKMEKQIAAELNGTTTPDVNTGAKENATSTLQVTLNEQNNSGQSGKAVITEANGKLKVIVNITGKPSSVEQPAHIHLSTCDTIGTVKYPLTNVGKGAAETTLDITMADLIKQLPLSINVHKSAAESKVYVACGNITTDKTASSTSQTGKSDDKGSQKAAQTVIYNGTTFSPATITVNKGDSVTFINASKGNMSVASDPHPQHTIYPEFDQYKTSQRGKKEFTFTFDKVGTWGYHNHLNTAAVGTVIVK